MSREELLKAAEEHFREHGDTIEFKPGSGGNASYDTIRGDQTVYAYGWLKDWMDAEDAVMETYARMLELDRVHDNFGGQFKIILDNVMRDSNRHDKVVEQIVQEDCEVPDTGGNTLVELAEGLETDPAFTMEVQERVNFIMESSNAMSVKAKAIVRMSYIYGYTPLEISKLLSMAVKRVYNTLVYYRKQLQEYDDD